jgi:hypothetical protein
MINPFKSLTNILAEGVKQKKLLLYGSYVLSKVGLTVVPYYLTQEAASDNLKITPPSKLGSISCGFLTLPEIGMIYANPETRAYAEIKSTFKNDTCSCFGIKKDQEIIAFTWCNLTRCHSSFDTFAIKEDEAYLFNAYTYKKYRGYNLAPYLRYETYKYLKEIGRTRFFSYTEYFNTPAVNFKKKINARHVKLRLYIKLLFKFRWNITLKNYPV